MENVERRKKTRKRGFQGVGMLCILNHKKKRDDTAGRLVEQRIPP